MFFHLEIKDSSLEAYRHPILREFFGKCDRNIVTDQRRCIRDWEKKQVWNCKSLIYIGAVEE
jgi:hypothetical protein